ncbi:MAG: mannose-1-phosphate guanylyltransferase [Myxococcales bacterium]|nr:mannose-1-phosphate guanylyltransferase [Myxococcales bacterium]
MRHGVILAGGGGTRLWPASRRTNPKQFLSLGTGQSSLLAATAARLAPICSEQLWVVTAADQAPLVQEALPTLPSGRIIAEPAARNTAAALGLAAVHLLHQDPKAVMAAIPSDQHIGNQEEFLRVIDLAFSAAEIHEAIVTVGIVPTRPETGYGYLKVGDGVSGELRHIDAFVEKPDEATAEMYIASGDYLWNGGMFFTTAARLLQEIREHMPETGKGLDAIAAALGTERAQAVCDSLYPTLPKISIDYGVMERISGVMTIGGDFGWNDVGSWPALADYKEADENGNVTLGTVVAHEATGNIVVSDEGTIVALAGVSDLVVVRSGDAVLILPRNRSQDVKTLVDALRAGNLEDFL